MFTCWLIFSIQFSDPCLRLTIEFNLTMWNTYTWTCNSSEAWWYLSTVHNDQNDLAAISHDSCSVCGWGCPLLVREIQMEWRNTCRSGGMLACLSVGLKK